MPDQLEQSVKELFQAVFDLPPEKRARRLHAADPPLRAAVQELLQAHAQAGDFLQRSPLLELAHLAAEPALGQRLGPYRLLREIGRGGMATVYLAVRDDDEYQQQVAIKLLWPSVESAEVIHRFRQERQILASLDHFNIARLLDGGTTAHGEPYLVMEYIEGLPLTGYCQKHGLSLKARVQLFQRVCAAVAYAHQHLVIHRDLKPSNILVTKDGTAKLLDFGIAKVLAPTAPAEALTRTGRHWLTPAYASPEQLREEPITTASDVYSLGVLLYELLTGAPPHQLHDRPLHEIIHVVSQTEPPVPSKRWRAEGGGMKEKSRKLFSSLLPHPSESLIPLNPSSLPNPSAFGDLDYIAAKALRSEAHERYRTVEELSDDLTRYLRGEAVTARGGRWSYRAGKFIRRHKLGVTLAALSLAALLAGLFLSVQQTRTASALARQQRRLLYAAQMQQAADDWASGDVGRLRETLDSYLPRAGQEDLRGFEWQYLWQLGHRERLSLPHTRRLAHNTFCRDARLLVADAANAVSVFDLTRGQRLARYELPPQVPATAQQWENDDCQVRLAYLSGNSLHLYEAATGQTRRLFTAEVEITAFANLAGQRVLTGHADGSLQLWDTATGRLLKHWRGTLGRIQGIRHTERQAITLVGASPTAGPSTVQLWDINTQRLLAAFHEPTPQAPGLAGSWFWITLPGQTVKLGEAATGRLRASLHEPGQQFLFAGLPNSPNFFLTYGTDRTAKLYQLPTLRRFAVFKGHGDWVQAAAVSPDGQWLATGSGDRTIRLWDIATQRPRALVKGHTADLEWLGFANASRQLLSLSHDGTLKLWELSALLEPEALTGHTGHVFSVAFAPDGKTLATASADHTLKLWDTQTGQPLRTFEGHTGQVFRAAYSPDGRLIASTGEDRTARLWDAHTGRPQHTLNSHQWQIHGLAFAPDGKTLATGSDDKTVKLWDAATGHELRTLNGHLREVYAVAFAPDGRTLASGSHDGVVKLWDVASGRELASFTAHTGPIWAITFTRDGQQFVTGSNDRTAKLWQTATRQELRTFKGHFDEIFDVALTPDGTRLATASNDHTLRLWNLATGQQLLKLTEHTDQVWAVAFAPDGRTLASGSWDKTARLWRTAQP